MKFSPYLVLIALSLSLYGCPGWDSIQPIYSSYEPILAERSSLNSVTFKSSIPVSNPGQIYSYPPYIFINEIDKGYHIIDNSDSTKPKDIGFISILASHEIGIQNDILFSDNSTDLISVNISDIRNPRLLKRTENVFPVQAPPDNLPLPDEYNVKNRPPNTVIIEWRKKQ